MAFIEITNLNIGLLNDVFVTHGSTVQKLITGENTIINLTSSNESGAVNALNVSVSGLTGIDAAEQTEKNVQDNMLMNDSGVRHVIAVIIDFFQDLGFEKKQAVLMAGHTLEYIFSEAEKNNGMTKNEKISQIEKTLNNKNRCLFNNNFDES